MLKKNYHLGISEVVFNMYIGMSDLNVGSMYPHMDSSSRDINTVTPEIKSASD